jgi:hypothetical protein
MDADLYEHLNTTVTKPSSPSLQEKDSASNTDESADGRQDGETPKSARVRRTSASLPHEIDQVVNAIVASPWAARLSALVGNVRKQVSRSTPQFDSRQGETVFETTRDRASKELEIVRSGIAALASPTLEEEADEELLEGEKHLLREPTSPSRMTAASMFSYLKSTADAAQKKLTPALQELSKAEDAADAYLNKLGANFGQILKDAVTIVAPEDTTKELSQGRRSKPI